MRCKKILVINENHQEIEEMQDALVKINCNNSLHFAYSGKEALDMLMGSSSSYNSTYAKSSKVQPDVILLNITLADMSGLEFLGIMRRYYSLKKIKVFLLTPEKTIIEPELIQRLGIAGCLEKPLNLSTNHSLVLEELRAEISTERQSAFLGLPLLLDFRENFVGGFLQLLKAKTVAITNVISFKMATCAVSAVMITAVAKYTGAPQQEAVYSEDFGKTAKTEQPIHKNEIPQQLIEESLPVESEEIGNTKSTLVNRQNYATHTESENNLTESEVDLSLAELLPLNPKIRIEQDTTFTAEQ